MTTEFEQVLQIILPTGDLRFRRKIRKFQNLTTCCKLLWLKLRS